MGKRIETWKAIPGYEGLYECSDLGNVRSLDRVVAGPGGRPKRLKGKELSQACGKWPYLGVILSKEGKHRTVETQRLVLLTFVGPGPDKADACHNNGRPGDNRLCNLRWDTRLKNVRDRFLHGRQTRGENHSTAKLTEAQALEIRNLRGVMTGVAIAKLFGISRSTVSNIQLGQRWAHIT